KYEPNAWRCLEHVNLSVDAVVGWRHGPQKGETLAEHGAAIYVGDTPPDMDAARLAGATAVGVPTGPFTADELRAAGADIVLGSLLEFPDWFLRRVGGP
ncbi:MAG: HAD family hydrolase, partial [Acidimicrobiia bacterium]